MALKWYGDQIMLKLQEASQEMINQAALLIERQTKINITDNGQVDTGFMRSTVYAVTSKSNTYGPNATAGKRAAPPASPPEKGAVVGVAAEYAIYQEEEKSFLFRALEQVAANMGGEIVTAGKGAMGD